MYVVAVPSVLGYVGYVTEVSGVCALPFERRRGGCGGGGYGGMMKSIGGGGK